MRFIRYCLLLAVLLAGDNIAGAQQYVYVNTDSLIMRSLPESSYVVYCVMHAHCRLEVLQPEEYYAHNKKVLNKFYYVGINDVTPEGINRMMNGWVEKQYVVSRAQEVKRIYTDSTAHPLYHEAPLMEYAGSGDHDPNRYNYLQYPYPKYKGGEHVFQQPQKHVYYTGPRGGCYYLKSGKKVYVDKKYCR